MCKRINRLFPVLLLSYFGGSILITLFMSYAHIITPMWVDMLLSQLLLLLPAIGYVVVKKIHILKCLPYKPLKPLDALLAILFGYSMVPIMLLLSNFSMLFSRNRLAEAAGGIYSYPLLGQILLIAVVPPLIEEFVFRGLFYHSYRKNGVLGAALLSGFLFGVVHLNINQFCYAFVLGIVFALLVEATNSMFASILAHFAINTYSIIVIKLVPSALSEQTQSLRDMPIPTIAITFVMLMIMAAAFGALAFVIYRCLARRNHNWNHMKSKLSLGVKSQNGEKYTTAPLIITVVLCFAYMILTEYIV